MQNKLFLNRITEPEVAALFDFYPKTAKAKLKELRSVIIKASRCIEQIGVLAETVKWGEPSYVTTAPKTGSTIRLGWKQTEPERVGIYFKCTSNLVPTFRKKYPKLFYGGNRCISFHVNEPLPTRELQLCIALALTYHINKNLPTKERWSLVKSYF